LKRIIWTLDASNNLALIYQNLGRLSEAEALMTDVLKQTKNLPGEGHLDTIRASGNLANIYSALGKHVEAKALRVEVLNLRKEILGDRHIDTVLAKNNLGLSLCDLGRFAEAESLQEVVIRETKGAARRTSSKYHHGQNQYGKNILQFGKGG
jgi:tetratricopeptide (TPR) repeat protein